MSLIWPSLWVPSLKVKKCLKCKEQVLSKKIQVIRKEKLSDMMEIYVLLCRETSRQENRRDFESWKPKCRFKQKKCFLQWSILSPRR